MNIILFKGNERNLTGLCRILMIISYLSIVQTCETTVGVGNCSFHVQSKGNICSAFYYAYCTYQNCTLLDPNGKCQNWETNIQSNWNICLQYCCEIADAPQTYSTLSSCNSSDKQTFLVGLLTGGASLLVTACIIAWCCRNQLKKCCKQFKIKCCLFGEVQIEPDLVVIEHHHTQQLEFVDKSGVNIVCQNLWAECLQSDYNLISQTNCAICLELSPTIQLQCQHLFHRKCIIQWIFRRKACPLCQSHKFDLATVFCEKCIAKRRSDNLRFDKLLDNKPQICFQCLV